MKHLSLLFLIILLLTQCTIEKRLYNKGFYIERRHSINSKIENNSKNSDEDVVNDVPAKSVDDNPVSDESNLLLTDSTRTEENVYGEQALNLSVNKTQSVELESESWDKEKKRRCLKGVGVPTLLFGLVAAATLDTATAAGAQLGAILIFGAIGWLCAFVAAVLLIIFLVFLCIPPMEKKKENAEKPHQFNKGERAGLIVTLTLVGVVVLAFLFTGLDL